MSNYDDYDDYDVYDDDGFVYTRDDLEDMYRDALDGNPDAYWNID